MNGHAFEILPVGHSPARAPFFTYHEDGEQRSWDYADSWQAGMDSAFSTYAWPGGYALAYYDFDDGSELCADCAREHYMDTGIRLDGDTVGNSDRAHYGTGIWCDGCSAVIVEPHCAECGREEDHEHYASPTFLKDNGDGLLCAHCMAEHVTNGHAMKTGLLTYQLDRDPWYGGGEWFARPR